MPAGKYAMSDRGHVLSDDSNAMPGWPDLLSTAVYTVSANRYAMPIICDAVSACVYAVSTCMYAVSDFGYIVCNEVYSVFDGFRNVVSSPGNEVSSA